MAWGYTGVLACMLARHAAVAQGPAVIRRRSRAIDMRDPPRAASCSAKENARHKLAWMCGIGLLAGPRDRDPGSPVMVTVSGDLGP